MNIMLGGRRRGGEGGGEREEGEKIECNLIIV